MASQHDLHRNRMNSSRVLLLGISRLVFPVLRANGIAARRLTEWRLLLSLGRVTRFGGLLPLSALTGRAMGGKLKMRGMPANGKSISGKATGATAASPATIAFVIDGFSTAMNSDCLATRFTIMG